GPRSTRPDPHFSSLRVLVQALVGGLRVLLDHLHVAMVDTSVGRLFAMLHACLAQLFVCTLIAITVSCTRGWINGGAVVHDSVRRAGVVCCALLFIQLGIAAVMRHSFAGLAIPTFPYSTPDGGLLPDTWNFRIAIHFAHRAMAVVLAGALTWFAYKLWIDQKTSAGLRVGALALVGLLTIQIILGAQIIWTHRSAATTTGHVAVGALTLAVTFWLTWVASRTLIERKHGS
ncbi:MAG TPA: COX15/CtaA family protein, partial [Opitutus sp.]|nr:COX15/CtaA family protein [Opitutus sp.]